MAESALKEVLREVCDIAFPTLDTGWPIDFSSLCDIFKAKWLYESQMPHPIDYSRFSGSLFILFYKNISVTNLSCAELVSLLQINSITYSKSDNTNVSFFSDKEYTKFIEELFKSVALAITKRAKTREDDFIEKFIEIISSRYGNIIESTLVLNFYHTSALVHVPQSRKLNVKSIISESGYIHSGGSAIYIREVDKVQSVALESNIRRFVNNYSDKKIFTTPYADEFFSPYDGETPVSTRKGISDVKIKLRKHFIENKSLIDYLSTMPTWIDNVYVPTGLEDFKKERLNVKDLTETRGSIWFIVDSGITDKGADDQRVILDDNSSYLIVYEQAFLNDSQFILFKERKPGWYASITMPHTLSSAIINVIRSAEIVRKRDPDKKIVILDPFAGTGTTLIDSSVRIANSIIIGFDRDPISSIATRDNFEFFARPTDDLIKANEIIEAALSFLTGKERFSEIRAEANRATARSNKSASSYRKTVHNVLNLIDEQFITKTTSGIQTISSRISKALNEGFSEKIIECIFQGGSSKQERFLFYILWRSLALGTFSIRNNEDNIIQVLKNELNKTHKEIEHVIRLDQSEIKSYVGSFLEREGLYSHALSVNPARINEIKDRLCILTEAEFNKKGDPNSWEPGVYIVKVNDSVNTLTNLKDKVDIIVTDPPYGFNTEEDGGESLANSFGKLGDVLVSALKPGGQLALVLPSFARNGREIPFFETRGAIVRQILTAAEASSKSLIEEVHSYPSPKKLFRKPYFWASTSVLERTIVYFSMR